MQNESSTAVSKKYEESLYSVEVVLPGAPGQDVETDFVTRERPFAMTMITHGIIGDELGTDQECYAIDWSIQNEKRYWKGPSVPMSRIAFGSVHTGRWIPFPQPIPIEAKTTIFVRVVNRYVTPGDTRKIQVIFHGLERVIP